MNDFSQFGIVPLDYSVLENVFPQYKSLGHKIAQLEKKGILIRLKRGVYVVSPKVSQKVLSEELIANHLYGPSYVSMESALKYYGLIPEAVYTLKSMTLKRSKTFVNSISTFQYISTSSEYYAIGIKQISIEESSFLMASPEKALCDLILYTPNLRTRFRKAMATFLEEDLRFDMDFFSNMDAEIFRQCAHVGKKKNEITNLLKLMEK